MFVTDLYKCHSVLGRTVTELKKRHNFLGIFGLIWTQGKIVTFSETDGILEWSGSEEPLCDRRIDLLHTLCDRHITVQPGIHRCNNFYTGATITKNNATTKNNA
jgi:hypothetical protein